MKLKIIVIAFCILVIVSAFKLTSKNKPIGLGTISQKITQHEVNKSQNKETTTQPEVTKKEIFAPGKYQIHTDIPATVFWVGEKATDDNDFITNEMSFWDVKWMENFGGIDDPNNRNGYHPAEFAPKENPFYFALPYAEFDTSHQLKADALRIPWYKNKPSPGQSIIKNHWIKIAHNDNVCYGQWEDVGPGLTDDFNYVFSDARPKNNFTGIDLSPALRDCLKIGGRGLVTWQFVDDDDVSNGPWKEIVTKSQISWR